jgi:hypothetical protein
MFADDGVEARAIRQQRMQQKKSWPVAELRRRSIPVSLSKLKRRPRIASD